MANSSLIRTGEKQPILRKGHGTEALGPSDSSDSGSDIVGAPGLDDDGDALDLQRGTTSDLERNPRGPRRTAGPDVGDENLDSDTDAGGTGERAAAGRDAPGPNDEQLEITDEQGGRAYDDTPDLQQDLVEDDRGLGDEAAPGVRAAEEAKTNRHDVPRKPRKGGARLRIRGARSKR